MLDTLREKGVRTSFFVLGWWAERQPDILRRIADDGHEVASHGHSVFDLTAVSDAAVRDDLERADAAISAVTGKYDPPALERLGRLPQRPGPPDRGEPRLPSDLPDRGQPGLDPGRDRRQRLQPGDGAHGQRRDRRAPLRQPDDGPLDGRRAATADRRPARKGFSLVTVTELLTAQ